MSLSGVIRASVGRGAVLRGVFVRHASSEAPAGTLIHNTDKIQATLEDKTGICRVVMQNAPVNAMDKDVLLSLGDVCIEANESNSINAIVLSSAIPKVFSAGLDVQTMLRADKDETSFKDYWKALQRLMCALYMNHAVTVAAVDGSCLGGGMLVAGGCDYRITTDAKHKFGFMETSVAVDVPVFMTEMYKEQVGMREASQALQLGKMFDVGYAQRLGYVEEVCPSGELSAAVDAYLRKALAVHKEARHKTKMHLRQDTFRVMEASLEEDLEEKYNYFRRPEIKKAIMEAFVKAQKGK